MVNGISNTEKFSNNTPVVQAFDKVFASEVDGVSSSIKELYYQLKDSKYLSNIVFDGELFEFSNVFVKEFFNNIYDIMDSYASIGTHESLISLIKNILGSGTTVEFSSDSLYDLILNIGSSGLVGGGIDTVQGDNVVDVSNNSMVYTTNRLGYTEQQLIDLIGKFIPIGIKYQINFGG